MSRAAAPDRFMAMKGQGYYSKATTGAKDVIDRAMPLVIGAIDRMYLKDDGTVFRIADMGCADGGTSIDLWRRALTHIRETVPSRPIEMVYTDLPRNDFSQLFRNIHGQTDLKSYLGDIDNVFVFASATSFHRPVFPPDSLNLGFSSTASHYISRVPCNITGHVHMVGAKGKEREAFAAQAAFDWETMLATRARELVPGGRLCLFNFGIDEEGRYLGHTRGISMFDTFNEIWAGFVEEGKITREEYLATNFPQHYRTVEEFVTPLEGTSSPAYREGLRLEHVESRIVRCPYARAFEAHRDALKFARDYIPTLRSWSEPVFLNGLSASRGPEDKAAIVDEFYDRYEARVAASPQRHGMDYVHIYLVLRKDAWATPSP